jgi:hypothetical protein
MNLTGPSSVTLAQLERDRSSGSKRSFELPRDEDGHLLCVYQACEAPVRAGDDEVAFFEHLEQHDRDGLRLLPTMVSFASIAPSFTVLQRRAQLAAASAAGVEPPSVSDLLSQATQRGPAVWDVSTAAPSAAATVSTGGSGAAAIGASGALSLSHSADNAAAADADKASLGNAIATNKPTRRLDVTTHGYNFPVLSTLSEGARLQIKCPIDDCPKIIQGFLYHVHAHLMAHRRAEAKGEALVIRKDRQLDVKASKRAAAALAAANGGRQTSDDDAAQFAATNSNVGSIGDDDDDDGASGGSGARARNDDNEMHEDHNSDSHNRNNNNNNNVNNINVNNNSSRFNGGGGGGVSDSNDSENGDDAGKIAVRRRKLAEVTGDDADGDDGDDEYGEVRKAAKRKAASTPSYANGAAKALGELIFCDDPRWLPLSEKANMMRDFVARYGAGFFRQTLTGEFVCFFANCGASMHQNFPRHLARHARDGDAVDEQVQLLADEFHARRGTRTMD